MKTVTSISLATSLFLATSFPSPAIVGLDIERDCADIVVSWPSQGYEYYLIQHRPTLDPNTPWQNLTNNYPANSTSRTTYRITEVVPPCSSGANRALGEASRPLGPIITGPQVMPADESRPPVPLNLYPPGIDLTGQVVLWPDGSSENWTKALAEEYAASKQLERWAAREEPQPQGGEEEGGAVDAGFFRVFQVPDFVFDYSDYQFESSVEFLPIDLGADPGIVVKTELFVDGEAFRAIEPAVLNLNWGTPSHPDIRPTYGLWFFHDRLTNGVHQLQLQTTLQLDRQLNEGTPYLTLTNLPMIAVVSNPIVFASWKTLMVGTNHTFQAQTTIYPADWYIDVYDAWGYWVTGAAGTTTNGNISWTWDFYDDWDYLRDAAEYDPFFDPYVTVMETANKSQDGPQATGDPVQRPAPFSSPDYPTQGGWIIAYQDNAKHIPAAREVLNQVFSTLGGTPAGLNLPTTTILLKFGNTNDIGMTSDPVQNMIDRNASWDDLRNAILHPQYRNLYIYAHGERFSIGGDWTKFKANGLDPDGSDFDSNEYTVGTNKIYSTTEITSGWCYRLHKLSANPPHPYRFVFFDGCTTATGDWPYPFGIVPLTNSLASFKADAERPNAFVGWNQTIYFNSHPTRADNNGWGGYQRFADFRSQWMFLWRYPTGTPPTDELWKALDRAATTSGWVTSQRLSEIISVYGYNDLKFNDYNQRTFSFPP